MSVPPMSHGRRMPHREEVRSLSLPASGLANIDSREPAPATRAKLPGARFNLGILGISPWIKPLKFALSIGIYLWSLAWFLAPLRPARPRAVRIIGGSAIFAMAGEIVAIAGQSLRGETSHFNEAGPLNAIIFGVMGLLILLNTIVIGWMLWLYLSVGAGLPRPHLLAVRLGVWGVHAADDTMPPCSRSP